MKSSRSLNSWPTRPDQRSSTPRANPPDRAGRGENGAPLPYHRRRDSRQAGQSRPASGALTRRARHEAGLAICMNHIGKAASIGTGHNGNAERPLNFRVGLLRAGICPIAALFVMSAEPPSTRTHGRKTPSSHSDEPGRSVAPSVPGLPTLNRIELGDRPTFALSVARSIDGCR